MNFYLVLNNKYTDPNQWISLLETKGDTWFFNKGEIIPHVGSTVIVYNKSTKKALVEANVVDFLEKPEYIPISSDKLDTNRRLHPQQGLVLSFNKKVNYKINTKNLIGTRIQSTVKIDYTNIPEFDAEYTVTDFIKEYYNETCIKNRIIDKMLEHCI